MDKVSTKTHRSTRHQDLDKADPKLKQMPDRVGELLPTRSVQGRLQRGRPLQVEPTSALDQSQVRGQIRTESETTPTPLLRRRIEIRPQRDRAHRRLARRGGPVPIPRPPHRDPVDPDTGSRTKQLTTGQDTWSARCAERRTPGAGGGSRETNDGNIETAPANPPHSGDDHPTPAVRLMAARGEIDNLVFATHEAVINALAHGRPPTLLRLWAQPNRVRSP
jgi:hypothetical protein